MTEHKACKRCRRTKPLTAFPTTTHGRVLVTCTACRDDKMKRYRGAGQKVGEGHQLYYAHSMGDNPAFLAWNKRPIVGVGAGGDVPLGQKQAKIAQNGSQEPETAYTAMSSASIFPRPVVHQKYETPQEVAARKIDELERDIEKQVYNNMTKRGER